MRLSAGKLALAAGSVIVAFLLTLAVDRVASVVMPRRASLVFPPNSRFHLRTSEFEFDARVNSLGFRGPQLDPGPTSMVRVLAIGDSFTYGWGVRNSEAWPKVLERDLRQRGLAIEIANLGRPGNGPVQYANIAEVAVPLLKPRWIIVGLLQGDDLNQADARAPDPKQGKYYPVLNSLYPTLSEIRQTFSSAEEPLSISPSEGKQEWQSLAETMLAKLKPEERRRHESLAPDIRERFLSGDLNPYVIALAVRQPHYFSWLLNESSPGVETKVAAMAAQLTRIRKVAKANDANVLAVSIPNWPYVSHQENMKRLGFALNEQMMTTDVPDDQARKACREAGIESVVSVTDVFRARAAAGDPLYYPLDGHFTSEGQRAFAEALAPDMSRLLAMK